ncbi:PepSY-associated TM helix domain-containing protein [Chishuiella sp.]|uniref:PepSY-associated TM helix domain-containing protein n=1 Tax=Chishuiella sp. TaxID=1969467 RepID=UPI0028ADC131|nr:PepSY-associated TM helix domain-containing protein [Chishuiella sp.]
MEKRQSKVKKKVNKRSLFYRISAWLHLWLGLFSGIIIVIIAITGAILSFKDEISDIIYPELIVRDEGLQMVSPSELYLLAKKEYPDKEATFIWRPTGQAAAIGFGERNTGFLLYVNPFSKEIIKRPSFQKEFDFFSWALKGHRTLWLPREIGRPIINYSTLIFLITLLTGLVLWWPKKWTKAIKKQSFTIKWGAKTKRLNYDLHNVLGFYSLIILIIISMTGMFYGLPWFNKFLYWSTSFGKSIEKPKELKSDITNYNPDKLSEMMQISWEDAIKSSKLKGYYFTIPKDSVSTINIFSYQSHRKFYDMKMASYDRNSGQKLDDGSIYAQEFNQADFAGKIVKLNYDLHIGSYAGLFGRAVYFFITLIGASLPITGFLVWWFKKKK